MTSSATPQAGADEPEEQPRKRGRGRPAATEAEVAARKRQIVEAAFEVFTTQGYHDTAIADIAAHVGTGHGTIYRYFDNKRDLLDHVVDFGVERALDSLSVDELSTATSKANFRVQVTRLLDSLFTELVDPDPRLPRLLVLEAAAIDGEMLLRLLGMMETLVATMAGEIEQAQRRGFLTAGNHPESVARSLLGSAVAGLLAEVREPGMSTAERRRYVDAVVSMLCDNAPESD